MTPRWPGTVETLAFAAAFFDSILSPMAAIAPGLGPMKTTPAFCKRARKRFAFGQEAVTGMDGLGAGRLAGLDDLLDDEIAFGRGRRSDEDGVIGHLDMQRVAVGLGIDGDRRNSHLAGGLDDATGDLAAVCDQYPFEHVLLGWPWAGSSPAIWHAGPGVTIALPAKCGCANVLFPFRLSVAASRGRNARSAPPAPVEPDRVQP